MHGKWGDLHEVRKSGAAQQVGGLADQPIGLPDLHIQQPSLHRCSAWYTALAALGSKVTAAMRSSCSNAVS